MTKDDFEVNATGTFRTLCNKDREILQLRQLLKVAVCPNDCENGTIVNGAYDHGDGDVEYDLAECQWCSERRDALENSNDS